MATTKKVTKVSSSSSASAPQARAFVPTAEAKGQATKLRVFAVLAWILAIAAEIGAILVLSKGEEAVGSKFMFWIIAFIVIDLIFVIIGSLLWKKANRYDPASKKDTVRFFFQNQLGLIIAIIAFLPLVIMVLTNKDLDDKQKGILGVVAGAALLIAGYFGIDFNPPSQEEIMGNSNIVTELMGVDRVWWTPKGTKCHLYDDCQAISSDLVKELREGTFATAYGDNSKIDGICSFCEKKARAAQALPESASLPLSFLSGASAIPIFDAVCCRGTNT